MIRDIFPDVELLSSVPPDEVIAVGAALEAGLLVGRDALTCEEEPTLVEVSATDILVKVSGSQHSTETWLNVLKPLLHSDTVRKFIVCRRWMNLELKSSPLCFLLERHCQLGDITFLVAWGLPPPFL